jgi:hypothetical protein
VTYVVTVDTRLPEGARELDPLQREGVVFLLQKGLESIESRDQTDWKPRSSTKSWPCIRAALC